MAQNGAAGAGGRQHGAGPLKNSGSRDREVGGAVHDDHPLQRVGSLVCAGHLPCIVRHIVLLTSCMVLLLSLVLCKSMQQCQRPALVRLSPALRRGGRGELARF